jgi:gamma-glutamylcyclotransferase (GGCT)/AIG2-like uncharacterized protein YtfP
VSVEQLIARANALRGWPADCSEESARDATSAEREIETRYGVSRTLAVYGTLAPGRANHHVVAPLGGEWSEGVIEGDLAEQGWGATLGFPAFRPRTGGVMIHTFVLTSPALPNAWKALDEFEGAEYRRILVPVFHRSVADDRRLMTVANVYAAATPPERSSHGRS